jgi:uncharacterized protein YfbU (UPF0304 family)
MVPKTERFEMRLDPAILERVDAWRAEQEDVPSRAEAVRRLVEASLSTGRSREPLHLTNPQKLTVWLLTEILRTQKGYENQDTVKLIQEVIYGGHFWALDWEMVGVLHNHVDSPEAVTVVVDVLDMWSFIERAYAGFDATERARIVAEVGPWATDPKFAGFDGNNETTYLSIARFLVEQMRRFEDFKGRSFNSHSPTVARYRRMFRLFEPMRVNLVGRELSVSEVITLLKLD